MPISEEFGFCDSILAEPATVPKIIIRVIKIVMVGFDLLGAGLMWANRRLEVMNKAVANRLDAPFYLF